MSELPDFQNFSYDELQTAITKYYTNLKSKRRQALLFSLIIKSLTGKSAKNFLTKSEDCWTVNDSAIDEFKKEREVQIHELNSTILLLRQELEQVKQSSDHIIDTLQTEVKELKKINASKSSPKSISKLSNSQEKINVKTINDHQSSIFSRLLEKNSSMGKSERATFQREQIEIELNLIDNCFENLRNVFDELPSGITPIDIEDAKISISPFLNICLDSRVRISYLMNESEFVLFLKDHISDTENILQLFNSRSSNKSDKYLFMPLTPYEKRLIFYNPETSDSYLFCYERPSELQQRTLIRQNLLPRPRPFSNSDFQKIPSYLLFIQLDEAIKTIMITSHPINNIIFIPQTPAENSLDLSSFYILEYIDSESRSWMLDHHAFQISRSFRHQYLQAASQFFRKFYRDVFGDNKYRSYFWKILAEKKIERWSQVKILLENIRIVSEEYLFGKMVRNVLIAYASYLPDPETDTIFKSSQIISVELEFQEAQERWKKRLPPTDVEPEEWLNYCFDSYKAWIPEQTEEDYRKRWNIAFDKM